MSCINVNKLNNIIENITTVAHTTLVTYVIYILILCFQDNLNDLITWHVILLSFGWMFLMCEGIMSISKNNVITNTLPHTVRISIHWIFQCLAGVCVISGFTIEYLNKEQNSKKHFASWHGIMGFVAFVCCFPTYINGIVALFNVDLKDYLKPTLNKLIHAACGILTFLFGGAAVIFSTETHWFTKRNSKEIQDIWFGLLIFAVCWSVIQPLLTAYRRMKTLVQK